MYQYQYVSVRTNPGKGELVESGRYRAGCAAARKRRKIESKGSVIKMGYAFTSEAATFRNVSFSE